MLPLKSPLSLFMFDTILFSEFVGKKRGTAPSFQFHSEKLDTVPLAVPDFIPAGIRGRRPLPRRGLERLPPRQSHAAHVPLLLWKIAQEESQSPSAILSTF